MSKNPEAPSSSTPATGTATSSAVTDRNDSNQSNVKQLNSVTDLEKSITQSGNKVVLVEFYASWCGPCRMIAPKIEDLAKVYFDKILLVKVDVDDFEELAMQYKITSIPTFLIFKDKKQLEMVIGSSNGQDLENAVSRHCNNTKQPKPPEPTAAPVPSASGTTAPPVPTTSGAPAAKPPASAAKPPATPAKPPGPAAPRRPSTSK